MMNRLTITRALLLAALLGSGAAVADNLKLPEPGRHDTAAPRHGEAMRDVLAEYGEPSERLPAVGAPPISRWVYDEFRVYFEGDRVIHSVSR
ncbi:hypothetical protein Q4485_13270 [Granulosicoccaceae sp. 1_MG-2023]|nr:hypothetical protein [Granulosicoccaceae sp. 1_MG-2023]